MLKEEIRGNWKRKGRHIGGRKNRQELLWFHYIGALLSRKSKSDSLAEFKKRNVLPFSVFDFLSFCPFSFPNVERAFCSCWSVCLSVCRSVSLSVSRVVSFCLSGFPQNRVFSFQSMARRFDLPERLYGWNWIGERRGREGSGNRRGELGKKSKK